MLESGRGCVGGGGGGGKGVTDEDDPPPNVAHPDFLNPPEGFGRSSTEVRTVAQPACFGSVGLSISIPEDLGASNDVGAKGVVDDEIVEGLGILMPFAAAIFRSSFSSRFRSFSFRLSISS